MKKERRNFNKVTVFAIAAIAAALSLFLVFRPNETDFSHKYEGFDLFGENIGRENTYTRYRERHVSLPPATENIPVDIFSWTAAEGVSVLEDFAGENRVLRTEEVSFVEFTIHVETAGLYNLYM